MKRAYIYKGAIIVIVIIGVFLIYQLETSPQVLQPRPQIYANAHNATVIKQIQGLIDSCNNSYEIEVTAGLGYESFRLDKVNGNCNVVVKGQEGNVEGFSNQCTVPLEKMKDWDWMTVATIPSGISEFCQNNVS